MRRPWTQLGAVAGRFTWSAGLLLFLAGCPFGPANLGNVVLPYCGEDERVLDAACEPCPAGTSASAGALIDGGDTTCACRAGFRPNDNDPTGESCVPRLCLENQRVVDNECVACPDGFRRAAGDDASGENTQCTDTIICEEDERVDARVCVACPDLSVNPAGDDASGDDTRCTCVPGSIQTDTSSSSACVAVQCGQDERVEDHVCVPCDVGFINPPHRSGLPFDVATSTDTVCTQDDCFGVLDVLCRDFEEAELSNPDALAEDNFGFAVSAEGDFIVVGDPTETDDGGLRNGAVHIYRWTGGAWVLDARLTYPDVAPTGEISPSFGAAVAVSGSTLVVGAPDADEGRGTTFVYVRTASAAAGDNWGQPVDVLRPREDLDRFDGFGRAVTVDGSTIAVGAPGRDTVYVFTPSALPNEWGEPVALTAEASFGHAVALYDGGLVVGAPDAATAALYVRDGVDWRRASVFTDSVSGRAGASVAIDDNSYAVGAPERVAFGPTGERVEEAGAVLLFDRDQGMLRATLTATNAGTGDGFGVAVALQDGQLAVGGPFEDSPTMRFNEPFDANSVRDAGAVYLFERRSTVWTPLAYVKAISADVDNRFGQAVAYGRRLVISAPGTDPGGQVFIRSVK